VILHRIRRAKARFFEELLGSKTHIVLGALRRAGMGSAAARRVRFSFQGPSPPREVVRLFQCPDVLQGSGSGRPPLSGIPEGPRPPGQ
jgi:hypothetical protein